MSRPTLAEFEAALLEGRAILAFLEAHNVSALAMAMVGVTTLRVFYEDDPGSAEWLAEYAEVNSREKADAFKATLK